MATPTTVPRPIFHMEAKEPIISSQLGSHLRTSIAQRGHELTSHGKGLVQCSRCRRWGRSSDLSYWANTSCWGSTASLASDSHESYKEASNPSAGPGPTGDTPSDDNIHQDPPEMISRSQAARIRRQHYAEERRMNKERETSISEIHTSVGASMATGSVVQEQHLQQDKAIIPFYIHPSHDVIYVGGFVACTRCGVANSQPLARKQLPISMACEPDSHGNMRPETGQGQRKLKTSFQNLRRLKNGLPPY